MRCLPASKNSIVKGNVLHDWHAETLAIRAFNRFLLDECLELVAHSESESKFVCRSAPVTPDGGHPRQPFSIRDGLEIVMYCSETPCGDASMELVMEAQEDATPWPEEHSNPDKLDPNPLLGRGYFSHLGAVRRKPGMLSTSVFGGEILSFVNKLAAIVRLQARSHARTSSH